MYMQNMWRKKLIREKKNNSHNCGDETLKKNQIKKKIGTILTLLSDELDSSKILFLSLFNLFSKKLQSCVRLSLS